MQEMEKLCEVLPVDRWVVTMATSLVEREIDVQLCPRLQELNEQFSRLSVDEARVLFEEEVCVCVMVGHHGIKAFIVCLGFSTEKARSRTVGSCKGKRFACCIRIKEIGCVTPLPPSPPPLSLSLPASPLCPVPWGGGERWGLDKRGSAAAGQGRCPLPSRHCQEVGVT